MINWDAVLSHGFLENFEKFFTNKGREIYGDRGVFDAEFDFPSFTNITWTGPQHR